MAQERNDAGNIVCLFEAFKRHSSHQLIKILFAPGFSELGCVHAAWVNGVDSDAVGSELVRSCEREASEREFRCRVGAETWSAA